MLLFNNTTDEFSRLDYFFIYCHFSKYLFPLQIIKQIKRKKILKAFFVFTIVFLMMIPIHFKYIVKSDFSILVFSDIHLDKYYQAKSDKNIKRCEKFVKNADYMPLGRSGCYSPPKLIEYVFQKMKSTIKNPDLVIFGGDSIAFKSVRSIFDVEHALAFIFNKVKETFPNSPFLFVPGNTDFFPSYSMNNVDVVNINRILNLYRPFLMNNEMETFRKGGYFQRDFKDQKLRFITLNSVLLASSYRNEPVDINPYEQLSWLNKSLFNSSQENLKTIVLSHIFPCQNYCDCWREKYTKQFESILMLNTPTYILNFHTHLGRLRQFFINGSKYYSLTCPSISPSHDNYPSFRIIKWRKATIRDILDYEISNDSIYVTSFRKHLSMNGINQKEFNNLRKRIQINEKIFHNYIRIATANWTKNYLISMCNQTSNEKIFDCISQADDIFNVDRKIIC